MKVKLRPRDPPCPIAVAFCVQRTSTVAQAGTAPTFRSTLSNVQRQRARMRVNLFTPEEAIVETAEAAADAAEASTDGAGALARALTGL